MTPKELEKAAEDYTNTDNFGYVEIGWTEIRNKEKQAFIAGANFAASTPSEDQEALWLEVITKWEGIYRTEPTGYDTFVEKLKSKFIIQRIKV